jgi:Leucine-rich repeat (LRR) protein
MSTQAVLLIQKCLETKDPYLDLGNCGLTDYDFAEGSSVDILLRQCTHLETLVLSNGQSTNKGDQNRLNNHPPALPLLKTLSTLICAGSYENKWGIKDMSFVASLTSLTSLNVSYNQVSEIKGLDNLNSLQQLYLSQNQINEIKGLDNLNSYNVIPLQIKSTRSRD